MPRQRQAIPPPFAQVVLLRGPARSEGAHRLPFTCCHFCWRVHRLPLPVPVTAWLASFSWPVKVLLGVYSLGFLVGTYTHARGILEHGFLATPVPTVVGVYWDVLTVLDPLAVVLFWWRPRAGLWLAVVIMTSDIAVNTWVYMAGYFGPPTAHMVPLSLFEQALFGLLVFVTVPLVFAALNRPDKPLAPPLARV